MKTLFLAWQTSDPTHAWYPIGRLDAEPLQHEYRFRYVGGALNAQEQAGFKPLLSFPELNRDYRSSELFPLFKNRVLSPSRSDYNEYVGWLGLKPEGTASQDAMALDILEVSGGERATDNLEVFPQITMDADQGFRVHFFLHGLRHLPEYSRQRADDLRVGETLRVMVELNNPATRVAVPLLTENYVMVGWTPRYLVSDLLHSVANAPLVEAQVVQVNLSPAPANRRVLVEFRGQMPADYEPMSSRDFAPLNV